MTTFHNPHYYFLFHWHKFSPAQLFRDVIYHAERLLLFSCMSIHTLLHGCTHSGHQVTFMTKFCMVGPNVCGYHLWNMLDFSLLAPRVFEVAPRVFRNLCIPTLLKAFWGTETLDECYYYAVSSSSARVPDTNLLQSETPTVDSITYDI